MLSLFSISLTQQSSGSAVAASAGTFLGSTIFAEARSASESSLELQPLVTDLLIDIDTVERKIKVRDSSSYAAVSQGT